MQFRRNAYQLALLANCYLVASVAGAQDPDVVIRIPSPPQAQQQQSAEDVPAATSDERLSTGAKRLEAIRISPAPPVGELPPDQSVEIFSSQTTRVDGARDWYGYELNWCPTALRHKTLYFDDVVLEHFGQSPCPAAQPILSAGRFFATIPAMPVRLLAEPPCASAYSSFGQPRPGLPAPCLHQRVGH